jgi:hypothetical protein
MPILNLTDQFNNENSDKIVNAKPVVCAVWTKLITEELMSIFPFPKKNRTTFWAL